MTRNGATIFYAVFAALMFVISLAETGTVLRMGSLRQRIAFTRDGVMVPKTGWTEEERLILYESIVDLTEKTEPIQVIVIRHRDGEFTLMLDMLADERAFAEIGHELAVRAGGAVARASGLPPAAT